MAFSSGSGKGPMADINVTPLVDVMLVLLIIFIVTAPIMTYPIGVALPDAAGKTRPFCRPCLDWSERRPHLAGALRRSCTGEPPQPASPCQPDQS